MNITTKLVDLGRKVAALTQDLQGNVAELRQQIRSKRAELSHAENGLLPREEIRGRIRQWITANGEFWRHHVAPDLPRVFGEPVKTATPWNAADTMTWGAACALFPDVVTAGLFASIDAAEYQSGPSSAERPAVVAKLGAELAALEAAEEHAIDEANAAGVSIAHRPETVQRREGETRRRQLSEQARADQAKREEAINTRHDQRRVARSTVTGSERSRIA